MTDDQDLSDPIGAALADLTSGRRGCQAAGHERILQMCAPDSLWRAALLGRLDAMLAHKSAQVRGTAYLALATAQRGAALPKLLEHLDEPEADARLDLVEALALLGEVARAPLLRFLSDELFEIRFAAAGGLLDFGDPRCFDALREGLGFSDTRYLALSGLYRLGDPRALEPARAIFGKLFISGFERVAAAGLLAKLGDGEGRRFLLERLRHRRALDRGLALELLGELRAAEAYEAVRAVLLDRRDPFRGAAARALGCLGNPEALELLAATLDNGDEEPELRMDAAEGLMNLKTESALQALRAARARLVDGDTADMLGAGAGVAGQQELIEVIDEAIERLAQPTGEA